MPFCKWILIQASGGAIDPGTISVFTIGYNCNSCGLMQNFINFWRERIVRGIQRVSQFVNIEPASVDLELI